MVPVPGRMFNLLATLVAAGPEVGSNVLVEA